MKELRNSSTYRVLHEDELALLKLQMEAAGAEAKAIKMAISLLKDNLPIEFIVKHMG